MLSFLMAYVVLPCILLVQNLVDLFDTFANIAVDLLTISPNITTASSFKARNE